MRGRAPPSAPLASPLRADRRAPQRLIQKEIQDRLALALLEGEITDGDHVLVDRQGDSLALHSA